MEAEADIKVDKFFNAFILMMAMLRYDWQMYLQLTHTRIFRKVSTIEIILFIQHRRVHNGRSFILTHGPRCPVRANISFFKSFYGALWTSVDDRLMNCRDSNYYFTGKQLYCLCL